MKNGTNKISDFLEGEDGIEAQKIIKNEKPHIVITDIRMPRMDGLGLIEWAKENLKTPPFFIIMSGYDEFNYAQRAISYGVKEYLLKPIGREEILKVVNTIVEELEDNDQNNTQIINRYEQQKTRLLKEKYFRQLIYARKKEDTDKALIELNQYNVEFSKKKWNVNVIDYQFKDKSENVSTQQIQVLETEISKIINEELDMFVFKDWLNRFVIIYNFDEDDYELELKGVFRLLNEELTKNNVARIYIGIGKSIETIYDCGKAYTEAIEASLEKMNDTENYTKKFHELEKPPHKIRVSKMQKTIFNIIDKIEVGDLEDLEKLIVEMLDRDYATIDLKDIYEQYLFNLEKYFMNKGLNVTQILGGITNQQKGFIDFWDYNTMWRYVYNQSIKIANYIQTYIDATPLKSKLIDEVILYMEENYNENINLNFVADYFSKNNTYLSTLFKEETGENFTDFLLNIRMEKAKELLRNTDIKVFKIAQQTGYMNDKYFYRVFKKHVGMSPSEYRRRII